MTTPGKTIEQVRAEIDALPDCERQRRAALAGMEVLERKLKEQRDRNARLVERNNELEPLWGRLHAIAPGREIEFAEALPEIVEALKATLKGKTRMDGDLIVHEVNEPLAGRIHAILTKLGLNEGGANG